MTPLGRLSIEAIMPPPTPWKGVFEPRRAVPVAQGEARVASVKPPAWSAPMPPDCPRPKHRDPRVRASMIRILLAAICLSVLCACAGTIDNCPKGLDPPDWGSTLPAR